MLRLFSHHDRFEVYRIFNMLDDAGIPCFVKNELIQGAIGDIPPQDSEPEVWLHDVQWEDKAKQLISEFNREQQSMQSENQSPWICANCDENNEPSFNVCWMCQASR